MKPASIISLIIAVLLIIIGLVTCFIAQNMAQANGEFLFAEEVDGGYRRKEDLTESEISKIKLIADNVEINIYGQCDSGIYSQMEDFGYEYEANAQTAKKSYAEFINFRENYYSVNTTNRIMSFDEIPDIASMLKFWENNFSFKGIRYLINFKQDITKDTKKVINIYLCSDKDIKNFDIQSTNCTVNIYNMVTGTDYNITADTLTLTTHRVKTSSTININAGTDDKPAAAVTMDLSNTVAANLNVNASELNFNTDQFRCSGKSAIVCDTGSVLIRTVKDPSSFNLDLQTVSGKITVGDEEVHTPFTRVSTEEDSGTLSINSISADITVARSVADAADVPDEHNVK